MISKCERCTDPIIDSLNVVITLNSIVCQFCFDIIGKKFYSDEVICYECGDEWTSRAKCENCIMVGGGDEKIH